MNIPPEIENPPSFGSWEFEIYQKPQAKQSVRYGAGGRFHTSTKKAKYVKSLEEAIKSQWTEDHKLTGSIRLDIVFCFAWTKKDVSKGASGTAFTNLHIDIDNMLKPLKDSLANVCIVDDCQVVMLTARKVRHDHPFIHVKMTLLDNK